MDLNGADLPSSAPQPLSLSSPRGVAGRVATTSNSPPPSPLCTGRRRLFLLFASIGRLREGEIFRLHSQLPWSGLGRGLPLPALCCSFSSASAALPGEEAQAAGEARCTRTTPARSPGSPGCSSTSTSSSATRPTISFPSRGRSSRGRWSLITCRARARSLTSAPAPAHSSARQRLGLSYFSLLLFHYFFMSNRMHLVD